MILILDGYNVLKQAKGASAGELEKQAFIKQVVRYADTKKHEVILVFDGGFFLYPAKEQVGGVRVVYVGKHQIADDYIKRLIEKEKNNDVLVATSDNELCFFAHRRGIATIDALAFFKLLHDKEVSVPSVIKSSDLQKFSTASDNAELDALMELETRRIPIKKEEEIQKRERGQQHTKHEKRLLKTIKKL